MIKTGIYRNLSNKEYHADPALSNSMMSKLDLSPAHLKAYLKDPVRETAAFLFGSPAHCKILQPDIFDQTYKLWPKGYHRKKEEIEAIEANGQEWVKEVDLIDIDNMVKVLSNHEIASSLLSGGEAEVSYFHWHKLGFMCKARPDYRKGTTLIDLKSTIDASPEGFAKAMANFKYHRQAEHYMSAVAACGVPVENFVFIAQEKKPPYAVAIYRLQDEDLYLAHEENKLIYQKYAECLSTDTWDGYPNKIQPIALPQWYIKNAKI